MHVYLYIKHHIHQDEMPPSSHGIVEFYHLQIHPSVFRTAGVKLPFTGMNVMKCPRPVLISFEWEKDDHDLRRAVFHLPVNYVIL